MITNVRLSPFLFELSPLLTELEFRAARIVAARTKRPDTAFALLVALACVADRMPAARLADLIDVHRSGISLVAGELETFGVLVRTWSEPHPGKPHRGRGRERFYALVPSWFSKISFTSAGGVHDRSE